MRDARHLVFVDVEEPGLRQPRRESEEGPPRMQRVARRARQHPALERRSRPTGPHLAPLQATLSAAMLAAFPIAVQLAITQDVRRLAPRLAGGCRLCSPGSGTTHRH